jgi:hypothetical protein
MALLYRPPEANVKAALLIAMRGGARARNAYGVVGGHDVMSPSMASAAGPGSEHDVHRSCALESAG